MSVAKSYEHCEQLAKQAGKNFYYSFLALPRDRYDAMCALYAFMRITDDLGDSDRPTGERAHQLREWRSSLDIALAGKDTSSPYLPAIVDMVQRYQVPVKYLLEVIDGVEMDLHPVALHHFAELKQYCYHVAGVVGLACIHVWGFDDSAAIPLAIDCGTAFQLTNIIRDVREDALNDRVYLPDDEMRQFQVDRTQLVAIRPSESVNNLLRFQAARARDHYARSEPLAELIHPVGRPILKAMREIYGGLLHKIEQRNYDVFSERVSLTRSHKILIALRAICRQQWQRWFSLPRPKPQ